MAVTKAYIADLIFTGNEWLNEHAVLIEDGIIKAVLPAKDVPSDIEKEYFADSILAPAFIDLQIYGACEKLFAVIKRSQQERRCRFLHAHCCYQSTRNTF
jgi:N-acetylglucosamine-6-phosphate deacetylase